MRELGRGGALVAAAVAQLENKANSRLVRKPASSNGNVSMSDKNKNPEAAKQNQAAASRTQKNYDEASSSSDNEDYCRKKSDKGAASDKDSVSLKSSERDTSDLEESEELDSDSEESDEDDRTQESVLEKVNDRNQNPMIASPDRG